MTKKLFFTTILFLSLNLISQNTYVPDNNFEQALIDLGYDSGTLDDYVPTVNISSLPFLDISNKNISDLTGIEDFFMLIVLNCNNNQLTDLDLSQNPNLEMLTCENNLLTNINVSQSPNLEIFSCYNNFLTNLNVTQNPNLSWLVCGQNQLASLNISQNSNLELLDCQSNQITNLDISQNTSLLTLSCKDNLLTNLNVDQNPNLEDLYCSNNPINNLDVSLNTSLVALECNNNQLNNLNLSQNTNLETLLCANNQLSDLDLSQNTNLTIIRCPDNLLTTLNVKNGNNLNISEFETINNPNLTCITVDDTTYSTSNWTEIDSHTNFNEDCTLSINEYNSDNFFIYPNPVKNIFKINFELPISKINIYNNLGKIVLKYHKQENYDISDLTNGIYFVVLEFDKKIYKQKLIKH